MLLLRFWQPPVSKLSGAVEERAAREDAPVAPAQRGSPLRPWLPWICLTVFVFTWSLPPVKDALNGLSAPKIAVPHLHLGVLRLPPVVPAPEPEKAIFVFNWLTATGSALLLAGLTAGLLLGEKPANLARIYARTLWRVRVSLLTIALMLALGFTTRYSGSDTTMGLALAGAGWWFPFFSPLLGWLGVALTGSDTRPTCSSAICRKSPLNSSVFPRS